MSMEAIGQEFQRDHSTVVYSIKTMAENIARDQHLKETCSDIIKTCGREANENENEKIKIMVNRGRWPLKKKLLSFPGAL